MSMLGTVESLNLVFDLYSLRDRNQVSEYLELHPDVLPVLVEAYGRILSRFGSGTPVVLTIVSEPANRQSAELFALISTSLPVDQALEALRQFDEEWWLDVPEHQTGALNFDVEFV